MVEAKGSSQGVGKAFWRSVSAFSNTDGGRIILGLAEQEGVFSPARDFDSRRVNDQLIEALAEKPGQRKPLTPMPKLQVRSDEVGGATVYVVDVPPMREDPLLCTHMPCFLTPLGVRDGSFKRVLDGDVKLSPYEIFQLQNLFVDDRSDRSAVTGTVLEDLREPEWRAVLQGLKDAGSRIADAEDNEVEVLKRLNILDDEGTPTLAGLLVFGKYPQQYFPQLFIDVTVHPGTEKSDSNTRFLDRKRCDGPLPVAVEDAISATLSNLRTRYVERGARVESEPEIPELVIRESIVNAVMHRDYSAQVQGRQVAVDIYSDRVEINNPGGLYGDRTVNNLTDNRSASRNKALSKLLSLAYIPGSHARVAENQGSGISRMVRGMRGHGLPGPEFQAPIGEFTVVFRRFGLLTPEVSGWLDEFAPQASRDERVALSLAKDLGGVSVADMRRNLGLDSDIARAILVALESQGLLLRGDGGQYRIAEDSSSTDDRDRDILASLSGETPRSIQEIAESTGMKVGTLRPRVRALVEAGLIEPTAPPTSRKRRYLLNLRRDG